MKIIVTISRYLVGSLFIVSGLIKANDPLGFSYKLEEYFSADVLNMEFLVPWGLGLAVFICVAEIVLGIATLFGEKMKLASWSLLLMILFFTFLTFYSAYFNKVTDCGCFGDALKLTPWQSFTKDIVLLLLVLIIFLNRKRIKPNTEKENLIMIPVTVGLTAIFCYGVLNNTWGFPVVFTGGILFIMYGTKKVVNNQWDGWIMAVVATILSTYFSIYCLNHLPIKDFRPYAIGKNILEGMTPRPGDKQDVYDTILTYKNKSTGEQKDFTQAEYMDQKIWENTDWVWVNTETKLIEEGDHPPIHDFNLVDPDGNDLTQDILQEPYVFILVSKQVDEANTARMQDINNLANEIFNAGYYFIGATASLYDDLELFRHDHQTAFDFYSADETTLKTIIRSNPGLVLLKEGTILGKWSVDYIPDIQLFKDNYLK